MLGPSNETVQAIPLKTKLGDMENVFKCHLESSGTQVASKKERGIIKIKYTKSCQREHEQLRENMVLKDRQIRESS